jgi:hypothetical protein
MSLQTRVLATAEAGPLRAALSVASWPAPVLLSLEDTRILDIVVLDVASAQALLCYLDAFASGAVAPAVPFSVFRSAVLRGPWPSILQIQQPGATLNLDRTLARLAAGMLRRLLAEARQVSIGDLLARQQARQA